MKLRNLIVLILTIGIVSSTALLYFYLAEMEFSKNHREFLLSLNNLENFQSDLTHALSQSALHTYYNYDKLSEITTNLIAEYNKLKNADIIKTSNYDSINSGLVKIKEHIDENLKNIEYYLMLNAGVKNSLLFLSRHLENAELLKEYEKDIFIKATKILHYFRNSKKMQDIDYIKNITLLSTLQSTDNSTQKFITTFNLHTTYLVKKYPEYILKSKQMLSPHIHDSILDLRNDFSKRSINDFKSFDIFAFILFIIFIFALTFIIVLFVKYLKENKKLLETKESLEYSLTYDQLTKLYNRKAFEDEIVKLELPHLLIINIDSFKHINDIYGNDSGNVILKTIANLIEGKVSGLHEAKVYRLGGDEFGVLFCDIDSHKALTISDILEKEISSYNFNVDNQNINVFVSIASNNIHPILENADLALKLLKKDHTKRIIEYKESLNLKKSVQENIDTIRLIKDAISDDRVVPFFQPIINLQTSKIDKYEALVRLKLEDGAFLTPDKFLETSKKTPYYLQITKIMIEKTLEAVEEYPSYRFSVNISMIDILDDEITSMLFEKLKASPRLASRLNIELLESENLHDISKVKTFIIEVRKYGVKILLDDFGSGYSNFSYFSHLDVDVVKIDGTIVSEITSNNRKLHMLKSIYEFSKGMDIKNVAECVEDRETALILKNIGIEYAQGYYFGKPLERPLDSDEVSI